MRHDCLLVQKFYGIAAILNSWFMYIERTTKQFAAALVGWLCLRDAPPWGIMTAIASHPVILVAEDDALIGLAVETVLLDAGCRVLGPVGTADAALVLLAEATQVDGAVVDINLEGSDGLTVAAELTRRGIPFVLASGYPQPPEVAAAHPGATILLKPYALEDLERLLVEPLRRAVG